MSETRINEIISLWKEYKEKYPLLKTYSFNLTNQLKRSYGNCNTWTKKIKIQKNHALQQNWIQVRHTILHEIAHALSPLREHHGKIWKNKCIELGIPPLRYHNAEAILEHSKKQVPIIEEQYFIHLGHKCRKIIKQEGNNTIITYERI